MTAAAPSRPTFVRLLVLAVAATGLSWTLGAYAVPAEPRAPGDELPGRCMSRAAVLPLGLAAGPSSEPAEPEPPATDSRKAGEQIAKRLLGGAVLGWFRVVLFVVIVAFLWFLLRNLFARQ